MVFISVVSTGVRTIFHFIPYSFPFFSPCKWTLARQTDFSRKIGFFKHFNYLEDTDSQATQMQFLKYCIDRRLSI
jgi:hypothetical protein